MGIDLFPLEQLQSRQVGFRFLLRPNFSVSNLFTILLLLRRTHTYLEDKSATDSPSVVPWLCTITRN